MLLTIHLALGQISGFELSHGPSRSLSAAGSGLAYALSLASKARLGLDQAPFHVWPDWDQAAPPM